MKVDLDTLLNELKDLRVNEIDVLRSSFTPVILSKNEFLIEEGQNCNFLGFVVSGMLRHYYNTVEGEEITRWVSLEGNFITSLSSFLSLKPSYENILVLF